jgi:sulfite reductase (NADPH) hemoprotein beta-component
LLTDIICCPGLDFCSLANAATIPIAAQINQRFEDIDYLFDVGEVKIKMSGCMNACGHHHVGHIGILGVQKKGQQYYQFTLGGSAENDCTLGERLGPAIEKEHVVEAIANLLNVYIELREDDERFIDTFRRLGITPFKDRVYTPAIEHEDVQRATN